MRAVVLTTLDVEFLSVRAQMSTASNEARGGQNYVVGSLTAEPAWEIDLVQALPGNYAAAVEAALAVERFRPEILLFVGIGGGLKDVAKGDVVAASHVWNYQKGKYRGSRWESRPDGCPCARPLVNRALAVSRDDLWLKNVEAPLPRSFVRPIVAGDIVLAGRNNVLAERIRQTYGDAVAIETEGRGLVEAAQATGVDCLVIRGISDMADRYKTGSDTDGSRQRAANHAAGFMSELLRGYRPPRRVEPVGPKVPPPSSLEGLPPAISELLAGLEDQHPGLVRDLIAQLTDANKPPRLLAHELITSAPAWLSTANASGWIAAGLFASAHRAHEDASFAFERASASGASNPAHWLAQAAVNARLGGNVERATDLISRARSLADDGFVEALAASIRNDWNALLELPSDVSLTKEEQIGLRVVQAFALHYVGRHGESIRVLDSLYQDYGDRAMIAVNLATLLILGVQDGYAVDRLSDLHRASELAMNARHLMRQRRMDASPAVIAACQAAWLEGDGRTILSHALIPPAGTATDAEAADPEVLAWAARAALLVGATKELERIVSTLPQSFARALFEGAMADEAQQTQEAEAAYRIALGLASDDEDRYQALIRLARLGLHPLPVDPGSLDVSEDRRAIIAAASLIARNEMAEALRVLRPQRGKSVAAATALAECYQRADDFAGAISTLREAAERFGAWELLADAMELASRSHMWDDATQLALDALGRLRESSPIASHVRRGLIDIYSRRADWLEMERQARVELRVRPADPLARWAVVIALNNQNRRDLAWQTLIEVDSLEPLDSYQARVKMSLIATNNRTAGGISDVLDLSDAFPEDHDVRAMAMHIAHLLTTDLDLPAELGDRIRRQTQDFLTRFPGSESFTAVSASEPEELVRRMHDDLLIANKQTFRLIKDVQRGQLPYGVAVLGRSIPYSLALAARAAGPLLGIARAEQIDGEDYAAAIDALNGTVVTEASTLSIIAGNSKLRDLVISCFATLEITDVSVFDLNLASDRVILQPAMILVVDPVTGADRIEVPDRDDAARLATVVRSMAGMARSLRQVPCRSLPAFPGLDLETHGAWLSAIEIGVTKARFVYSDDVVIRQLARGRGLRAFGTYALLQALVNERGLDQDQLSAHLDALFEAQLVDMPEAITFIQRAINDKRWTSPAALAAAARPAIWSDPAGGTRFFTEIFRRVKDGAPDRLALWLNAALGGGTNLSSEPLSTFLPDILVTAMLVSADRSEVLPDLVGITRRRANEFQVADPFPQAVRRLISAAETELGPAEAAQYVLAMIASLNDADRDLATSIVSDPNQRSG